MYYLYILYSKSYDRFYIGQSQELSSRLERHNNGQVPSTKPYLPWIIRYYEIFETRGEAMKREKDIKNKKSRKYIEMLIDQRGTNEINF